MYNPMNTVRYGEQFDLIPFLQADTRDLDSPTAAKHKQAAFDLLLAALRLVPGVKEDSAYRRQGYLPEKIDRNAAYHGAAIKVFHTNRHGWDLVVSGSVNEEYPLRVSLVYLGFFVSHVLTVKSKWRNPVSAEKNRINPEAAARTIQAALLATNCPNIERKIRAKLAWIFKIWRFCHANGIPVKPIPYHLRHFIKWCELLTKHAGC